MTHKMKIGLLVLGLVLVLMVLLYVGQSAWWGGPEGGTGPIEPVGGTGPVE